jgi:tryptophanyl-tRNA synthetase
MPFNFGENLVKIPGFDGSGKMGKSEGNGIFLYEDAESIRKKVMRAVTDAGPTIPNSEVSEPIQNLFTIMKSVSKTRNITIFYRSLCKLYYSLWRFKKAISRRYYCFYQSF